ncbi:hypothetical protein BELL_0346g00020 [Botrytis elliptica]|uniref:Uncharacterized protein n=1 Tax=Botrytis elliptica TaxID=278938 RepID=A0A4Z1JJW8_9HELO|nr:hypothetical protein BELL_0346g00020 [Botrytis elliptica]
MNTRPFILNVQILHYAILGRRGSMAQWPLPYERHEDRELEISAPQYLQFTDYDDMMDCLRPKTL